MKLSVSQLRRIIKEEVSRMLVMEAGYGDPWEEPEHYDPRSGDEPPGYKPPKAKGIPDFHEKLKNFMRKYAPGDIDIPYNAEYGIHYTFTNDGKLKLKPRVYDAIRNIKGAMGKLKVLFPGVFPGLPEEF